MLTSRGVAEKQPNRDISRSRPPGFGRQMQGASNTLVCCQVCCLNTAPQVLLRLLRHLQYCSCAPSADDCCLLETVEECLEKGLSTFPNSKCV